MDAAQQLESADALVAPKSVAVWLSGKVAAKKLGLNPKTLARLADRRLITCRRIPGLPAKYLESSVDALAGRSTTLAIEEAGDA